MRTLGAIGLLLLAACAADATYGGGDGTGGGGDGKGDSAGDGAATRAAWQPAPKREGNLRVVTFNVRNFPRVEVVEGEPVREAPVAYSLETDVEALLDLLEKLDFDVMALQEIRDTARFADVLAELGARTGRAYEHVFSENANGNPQHIGIVVASDALALSDVEEHAELDVSGRLRPALRGRVTSTREGGVDFTIVVLHLAAGDSNKRVLLRQQQASLAASIVTSVAADTGDDDVIVLGDLNTAGGEEELVALDAMLDASAQLARQDVAPGCSAYFLPSSSQPTAKPTWTDQVYARALAELDGDVPFVAGAHCAENACEIFQSSSPETGGTFYTVSDHCPVYGEVRDADDD